MPSWQAFEGAARSYQPGADLTAGMVLPHLFTFNPDWLRCGHPEEPEGFSAYDGSA